MTNDATIEKIQEIARDNPQGFIYQRDELSGLIKMLEKPGREGDRQFLLESWNGSDSYHVDRVGRGSFVVEALCISVFGTIQPTPLYDILLKANSNSSYSDGLLQRFQLILWPEKEMNWDYVDRLPCQKAQKTYQKIVDNFVKYGSYALLSPENDNEIRKAARNSDGLLSLRFSSDGQKLFSKWLDNLVRKLKSFSAQEEPLEAHLGKYRSLMPSLALIFHLIEVADVDGDPLESPIDADIVSLAIDWCDFLEGHARKIYAINPPKDIYSAQVFAKKVRTGDIRTGMTIRGIYRNCWKGLKDKKEVLEALAFLEKHGWARSTFYSDRNGRPSEFVEINPEVFDLSIY